MKIHKLSIILLSILIHSGVSNGQQIIYQEGFENAKMQMPNSIKNSHENLFIAQKDSGFANLSSDNGQSSDFIIHGIDISEGVSFLSFWYYQNLSAGDDKGLKVYYRTSPNALWKLLAYYTTSVDDWKQETLFLPENTASYYIMFEGEGNTKNVILLDNIRVNFFKNAESFSEGNKVYVDTLYNFSSSYLKVEVSENQISGLPDISHNTYRTPGIPVSCPPNAIMENEPNCHVNYIDTTNSGCDSIPNHFVDLTACNGVICGKSGIYLSNNVSRRDFDWYRLVVNGTSSLSLKVVADFNVRVCVVNMIGGCDGIWLYPGQDLNTIAGDTAIINISSITNSSNVFFWIAPNVNQTVPCGSNYVMIYKTTPLISPVIPVPSNGPCAPAQLGPISIPDYTFYWQSTPSGISTANPAGNAYPVTLTGTYYLRGIYDPLSCWTNTSSITLGSPPIVSAVASPSKVCPGSQSQLTATGAVNYTWMPGNINGAQIHVNPTVTTTYSVTGSAGGCSVTSIAALTVNPIFDSTESMAICSVNSFVWHGQNLSATGTYFAHYLTKLGCDSTYSLNLNVVNCEFKILSLKLFLEGLYAGSNQMHQASGISEPQFDLGIADHINVSLNEATPPYALAYNFDNMEIYADGTIPSIHLPGSISGLYYIVVKHRNSIETWSAQPIDFSGVGNINYDFSTGVEQAYGNNMKLSDGVYTNWGGDVTQDGIVDGSDLAAVDNACLSMLVGYHPEDVNGDGIVDGSDLALIDNNSLALIKRMSP